MDGDEVVPMADMSCVAAGVAASVEDRLRATEPAAYVSAEPETRPAKSARNTIFFIVGLLVD